MLIPPAISTDSYPTAGVPAQNQTGSARQAAADQPVTSLANQLNETLSVQEQQQIQQLQARNQEVRAHEQAHLSAAGEIATGGASFTFATAPDGKRYAIGGEVNIDVSEAPGDPEATLRKAEQIRRAALAPAHPSAQDQQIASRAIAMANQARLELFKQEQNSDPDSLTRRGVHIDISV